MKVSLPPNIGFIGVPTVHPTQKELPPFSVVRGQVFALLDPVRDAAFLNHSVTDALGNTIPDMGLGVVDNGIFLYTTKQAPGNVAKTDAYGNRLYPIKFFWLGSPRGTNDVNDHFSIFVADVDPSGFYPGAPASSFLRNPRLVLSWQQAKNDIVNWFDANYPYTTTPPSNGVGQEPPNGQSNTTYGTLSKGGNPGNVSVMQSIDGQFWPVYDYVDNSVILYFSIKTPNINTKSIYAYKIADSEISSPATSSQFLGGVTGNINGTPAVPSTISSHRFSVISPDPLVTAAPVAGQQSAVFAYAYGVFDYTTPDHGMNMQAFVVKDIHGSPLNWTTANVTTSLTYYGFGFDYISMNNPDKLGSIFPVGQMFASSVYGMVLNCTTDKDTKVYTQNPSPVVLSKMQLRVMFFHFDSTGNGAALMGDSLTLQSGVEALGACRPQFTTLPDGLPKIIYNAFNFDQSIRTVYEYIDVEKLKPENQRELVFQNNGGTEPTVIPTFGKNYADIMLINGSNSQSPNPQSLPTVVEIYTWPGVSDYAFGFNYFSRALIYRFPTSNAFGNLLSGLGSSLPSTFRLFLLMLYATVKHPGPWLAIQFYGGSTYTEPVVRLHD